jgi:VanZ family protein
MTILPTNKRIAWTLAALWACVIATLSTRYFSADHTAEALAYTGLSGEVLSEVNHVIRKSAHFTEYAILGFWCSLAIYRQSPKAYLTKGVILATLICGLYAISDEGHQVFVPNRTPAVKDVLIDSIGAAFAIYVLYRTSLFYRLDNLAKKHES